MTYIIGNSSIHINNDIAHDISSIIKAYPDVFKICINSETRRWVLNVKRIVHLFSDVITIYSTLLHKIPHYDDITNMADETKTNLARLEEYFITLFGSSATYRIDGWESLSYEMTVKPAALLIVKACYEAINSASKCFLCVELFFLQFDNLKKLLVPRIMSTVHMVIRLMKKLTFLCELKTIVDTIDGSITLNEECKANLRKVEQVTSGFKRELRTLERISSTLDATLLHYTDALLCKLILKRAFESLELTMIKRRNICYQAAEHVLSIPLSAEQHSMLSIRDVERYLICIMALLFTIVIVALYRFFNIFKR